MQRSSPLAIFSVFLRLGLTSFGGPVAHLGYFREEFVARRGWLSDAAYADLVALCQFVPGPASSQTAFALGLIRGGHAGALAASLGFTLPSAILMAFAAYGLAQFEGPLAAGAISGLKILAVAVVAQAVWGMAKSLCPDRERASIAFVSAAVLLAFPAVGAQLAVIASGAAAGWILLRVLPLPASGLDATAVSRSAGAAALILFALLLAALPAAAYATGSRDLAIVEAFYRAGALVFGGGHVVLPLLEASFTPNGWVGRDDFIAGYGAAQAVPGPLFTFAAYLGALAPFSYGPAAGAAVGVIAIFLPGLLLIYGALPFWKALSGQSWARAALGGVNAAVVGLLAAALYDPIFTSAIREPLDLALALIALAALTLWRAPVILVASLAAAAGVGLSLLA